MQSTEVYRMLARRPRRGRAIFGTLALVLPVFAGISLVLGRGAWTLAAFLAGLLFALGFYHVTQREASARSIAENPQLVFWAHPTVIRPQNRWLFAFARLRFLMLHLRDGRQFEAGLPPDEMSAFISWLTEHNPDMRMGTYDNTEFP
jgi:hypothetical protein